MAMYTPEYQPNGNEVAVIETSKGTVRVQLAGADASQDAVDDSVLDEDDHDAVDDAGKILVDDSRSQDDDGCHGKIQRADREVGMTASDRHRDKVRSAAARIIGIEQGAVNPEKYACQNRRQHAVLRVNGNHGADRVDDDRCRRQRRQCL